MDRDQKQRRYRRVCSAQIDLSGYEQLEDIKADQLQEGDVVVVGEKAYAVEPGAAPGVLRIDHPDGAIYRYHLGGGPLKVLIDECKCPVYRKKKPLVWEEEALSSLNSWGRACVYLPPEFKGRKVRIEAID